MKRIFAFFLLSIGIVMLGSGVAFGQAFPTKTIRIVASEAGGAGDISARVIAQALSETIGQQVVVDNRGGGVMAGEFVSKAAPDGYTLLIYANSFWLMPLMRSNMPYDPIKGFTPIMVVASAPNVLVVHPSVTANSVKDFIALAKAKPGKINYGSAATGTSNHLAAELFKSMTGTDLVRVTYKGMASAVTALASGEVDCMFSVASVMTQVKAGRMKALGVSTLKPTPLVPGVPTIASTVPGYKNIANYVLFAPAGTPAPVVNKLNQEIKKVLDRPEVKEKFSNSGLDIVASSPEEAREEIRSELVSMGKVIKDANIRDE
jgi:tripartite-type tricarboxylate transporter receptor subunit TctC